MKSRVTRRKENYQTLDGIGKSRLCGVIQTLNQQIKKQECDLEYIS
jgi:hypothetical protein